MTATNSKENFSELLSSLSDGSPMWKLALSQMPAEVLEKEDRSLLMRAYWKTPAYRFHDELMSCVNECGDLSFSEIGIVLEDFLRCYKEAREDKEEISV